MSSLSKGKEWTISYQARAPSAITVRLGTGCLRLPFSQLYLCLTGVAGTSLGQTLLGTVSLICLGMLIAINVLVAVLWRPEITNMSNLL